MLFKHGRLRQLLRTQAFLGELDFQGTAFKSACRHDCIQEQVAKAEMLQAAQARLVPRCLAYGLETFGDRRLKHARLKLRQGPQTSSSHQHSRM